MTKLETQISWNSADYCGYFSSNEHYQKTGRSWFDDQDVGLHVGHQMDNFLRDN